MVFANAEIVIAMLSRAAVKSRSPARGVLNSSEKEVKRTSFRAIRGLDEMPEGNRSGSCLVPRADRRRTPLQA